MIKRVGLVVLLVASYLSACRPTEAPVVHPPGGTLPGTSVNLDALIGAEPGVYTWSIADAPELADAYAAGLSLAGGLLTLPTCAYTASPPSGLQRTWPFCATVQASRGGTVEFAVPVCADERLLGVRVACAMLAGDTLCRNPANGITIGVAETIQFYALVSATCSSTYTPPLPAGACPSGDPAFAFCR